MNRLLRVLTVLLLALTMLGASAQHVSYQGVRQDVTVDVRTSIEFAMGHIPGAINIPLGDIEKYGLTIPGIRKDSRILLYCRSGQRSETARALLEKQGFKHVINGGGMKSLEQNLKACSTQSC